MARTIQHDEIRAGDKIRIIEELTVSEYHGAGNFSFIEDQSPHLPGYPRIFGLSQKAEVQLIDRPISLPEKAGSIVRVSLSDASEPFSTWVLFEEFQKWPTWVSMKGTRKTPAEFLDWATNCGHFVEVVA